MIRTAPTFSFAEPQIRVLRLPIQIRCAALASRQPDRDDIHVLRRMIHLVAFFHIATGVRSARPMGPRVRAGAFETNVTWRLGQYGNTGGGAPSLLARRLMNFRL